MVWPSSVDAYCGRPLWGRVEVTDLVYSYRTRQSKMDGGGTSLAVAIAVSRKFRLDG